MLLKRLYDDEVVSLSEYPAHWVEVVLRDGARLRFRDFEVEEVILHVESAKSELFGAVRSDAQA